MNPAALAIFVKTPGFSQLNTRLAKDIGCDKAERFHLLSCKAIETTLKSLKHIDVYWWVAEEEALSAEIWSGFASRPQVQGSLGERLHAAYQELRRDYQNVVFIGADSPQLQAEDVNLAVEALSENDFCVAAAEDGGYALFSGRVDLPKDLWLDVQYSVAATFEIFVNKLSERGEVFCDFKSYRDVDEIEDLQALIRLWQDQNGLNEFQQKILGEFSFVVDSV